MIVKSLCLQSPLLKLLRLNEMKNRATNDSPIPWFIYFSYYFGFSVAHQFVLTQILDTQDLTL